MSTFDGEFEDFAIEKLLSRYGRLVTVRVPNRPAVTVTAICDIERTDETRTFGEEIVERLTATIANDGTVAKPEVGMTLELVDEPEPRLPFAFEGRILLDSASHWDAEFTRSVPRRLGER